MSVDAREPLWVFGYGSLIFRPGFAFVERRRAYVRGHARRFFQGSTDHRGVPGSPGRVVTLVAETGAHCWGMAYRVARSAEAEVLAALDARERGGYRRVTLSLCFPDGAESDVQGLSYLAAPDNANYLGNAPIAAIVEQVRNARGPSGSNTDYVLALARALRELGADDPHVFEIEERLLANG